MKHGVTPTGAYLKKCILKSFKISLYFLFTLIASFGILSLADMAVGLFHPLPALPLNGFASGPLEDKEMSYHDFHYTSSTNSIGLRGDEIEEPKTHTYRIMALGDSYTYGWGVEMPQTWIKRLETNLRDRGLDVEIINCGVPGAGPLDYANFAETLIPRLKPDLVMVELLQENDIRQSVPLAPSYLFPNIGHVLRGLRESRMRQQLPSPTRRHESSAEHREVIKKGAKTIFDGMSPKAKARFEQIPSEIKTLFTEGMLNPWMIQEAVSSDDTFSYILDLDSLRTRIQIRTAGKLLERIKKEAERFNASVVTVSIPNGVFDNKPMFERCKRMGFHMNPAILLSPAPDEAGAKAAKIAGVPYFEITQMFRDRCDDPDLYFELDHHFTPKGHELFATGITPFIEDELNRIGHK